MVEPERASPTPAVVQVFVESGPHAGATATWSRPGSYLIGRSPSAQLSLKHDIVASLEHCRLEIGAGRCVLFDLGGRQGTILNGQAIKESAIRSGDKIVVGMSRLSIMIGDPGAPTAAALGSAIAPTVASGTASSGAAPAAGMLDIPGYSLERKIGEGGMGVVYAARRLAGGERVAIKTIIPVPGAGKKSIDLFRREMKLLSGLTHDKIVRFVESGEHAGQIFLVMEYVEAIELSPLVAKLSRPHQTAVYCGVICQTLEALEYAHAQKLVHRDVKPRNLLVSRTGQELRVKLADFGLAKNFELAGLSQMTGDHEIRGTPSFMPWEQLTGSRYAKPTADIYSTAATLYFFLTGHPPGHTQPTKRSWMSITSLFTGGKPAASAPDNHALTASLADVPRGLAQILIRALAADPKDRFPSAAEMRQALLPFAEVKRG